MRNPQAKNTKRDTPHLRVSQEILPSPSSMPSINSVATNTIRPLFVVPCPTNRGTARPKASSSSYRQPPPTEELAQAGPKDGPDRIRSQVGKVL